MCLFVKKKNFLTHHVSTKARWREFPKIHEKWRAHSRCQRSP
jgi:hypothetical protein